VQVHTWVHLLSASSPATAARHTSTPPLFLLLLPQALPPVQNARAARLRLPPNVRCVCGGGGDGVDELTRDACLTIVQDLLRVLRKFPH
jgi:hypothetical protein